MPTTTTSSDELWIRRWLVKVSLAFGGAAGFLLGFVCGFRMHG